VHGITAGTATMAPLMLGLYLGAAGTVVLLIAVRLAGEMPARDGVEGDRVVGTRR
jgi:hypothetical protein